MRMRLSPLVKIAFTANLFEWYAFSLTIFMATEIGRQFFPVKDDKTALTLSFAVFASSYLARPFGSVFFGVLGNRRGTGAALMLSMMGMAVPAALIGFLPTYHTAGYFATVALVCLKLLQGFAAGGETPLSGYFVSLNAAGKNRGLYGALAAVSGFLGMLLASGVVFVVPYGVSRLSTLTDGRVSLWLTDSWRWPFLLSIPLSIWIYSIRSSIYVGRDESIDRRLCKRSVSPLIKAAALVAFMEVCIYTGFIWLPNYLQTYLGVSSFDARLTNVIALMFFSSSVVAIGYASRWVEPSHFMLIGIVCLIFGSYPLFHFLQAGFAQLLLAQAIFAVSTGCLVGVIFVILSDLFKDNWRNFGMATTYSISTAIFGGTAPIVSTYLIKIMHSLMAPAIYIMLMGMLAAPAAYSVFLDRNRRNGASVELS